MAADPDETLEELRRARPAQADPVARLMRDKVRAALLGGDVEPARIDRFTILERLGSGGMGAVYAAYDPKLDRRVAVKILHAEGEDARRRMLAEARAMARLSHPNVVAVYDASDLGDDVYLAMEFVAGGNLRGWLEAGPPRARVLDVFVQAGRGLAAAHAAGLVHGDVKPENVLVGDDGAVKVADFGLARAEGATDDSRAGTPAYMAPEQLDGAPADARSDQFAFAVALREALGADVPVRVARVIERALSVDPAARHPSMAALLAALAPRPSRLRRAALVVVPVVIAAVAIAIVVSRRAGAADPCGAADGRLAAVWNDTVRAGVAPRVVAVLDAYGTAWTTMARDTCEATRRGEQSPAMLDLRMACLDRRLDELGALGGSLAAADPARAIEAAYALPPLEPCLDRDQLSGVLPPTADQAAAVAELRHRLDRASALQKTRDYRDAVVELDAIAAEARALGYPPLLAEALIRLARLQNHAGDAATAEATLREAIAQAALGRDDEVLADAWTTRIFLAGLQGDRFAEAHAYAEAADAAAARALRPALVRGVVRLYRAQVLERQDRLDEAQTAAEEAIALISEARGAGHPLVAEAEQALAGIHRFRGDLVAARVHADRAVAIFEAAFGHDHQDTAVALGVVAAILADAGDLEGALAVYQDQLGRLRTAAGEDHLYMATAHANVGDILRRLGRHGEAAPELDAALAIYERAGSPEALHTRVRIAKLARDRGDRADARRQFEELLGLQIAQLGERNHKVADTINDLGGLALDDGDLERADQLYTRALAIYEEALGREHGRVAVALTNLGDLAIARRRFAEARDACARALAIDEEALGPEHPDLAYDLTCLGEAQVGLGDRTAAIPVLERALRLRADATGADIERTRAALARARR